MVYQAGGQNLDSSDSGRLYHCHEGGKLRPIYNHILGNMEMELVSLGIAGIAVKPMVQHIWGDEPPEPP